MSLPTTQQALFITSKHGDYALGSTEVYEPVSGELLVRIEAAALNPVDWKIRAYDWFVSKYPAIIGSDIAGVVVDVGEGVSNFKVGDRVFYQGWFEDRFGGFQHYGITPARFTAKIPDNMTFDDVATIPMGILAAVVGLYGDKWENGGMQLTPPWAPGGRGKYAGRAAFVFGGASSCGQFAIQFLRLSGFSPIITTSSKGNFELVQSLGATHALDRNLDLDIAGEVKKITSQPITVVFDAVSSKETQNVGYDLVAPGGDFIKLLDSLIDPSRITPDKGDHHPLGTSHVPQNFELGEGLWANLTAMLISGCIKPNVPSYVPGGLAVIPEQLEKMKRNENSGEKLVIHPWDE